MPDGNALDLTACEREPIHVPGSIQPHGVLIVVDPATDVVLQAAGDTTSLLAYPESVLGRTARDILGVRFSDLLLQSETDLLEEPTYLGTVAPHGNREELTIIAHKVEGGAIVEVERAVRPASAARTLASIRSITERIGLARNYRDACSLAAREVRRITDFGRVLIYQFLADGSGAVVAEENDGRLSLLLNHRFPASDIPSQARELYRRNPIRVISDVSYKPAPLVPLLCPATNRPLDMSHCALRSVSPVHIQYLKNMGVGASMSVSLLPRGELWGLIACHNATARMLPYELLEACRHVGQILSQHIRAREESDLYRSTVELAVARDKVLRALRGVDDPGAALLGLCPDLLTLAAAHGVGICWKGTVATAGHVPSEPQLRGLAAWLVDKIADEDVFVTDRLSELYPEAGAFAVEASGLLSIVLSGDDPAVLMWFRSEQVEEINWAGNPHEPVEPGSSLRALNPRRSFATWQETVRGRSRSWSPADIESVQGFQPRVAFVLQQHRVWELNRLLGKANDRLSALAATDGLTGVANRRAFDERLQQEWARAGRVGSPLALIIFDLDFFKQYNDHFGHLMGDECLKRVAQILEDKRRVSDFAARFGGEEFSLLLPDTQIEGAVAVAEVARSRIEDLHLDHPKSPMAVVTASFGVAVATPDGSGTSESLVQAADEALYDAKRMGRNRVVRADNRGLD
jgi:chemotaxis family two-component system sensor kinase Cph1